MLIGVLDRARRGGRRLLPGLVTLNLMVGLIDLARVGERTWRLEIALAGGGLSLLLAGWFAGTWRSRVYWRGVMRNQVHNWRQVVDVLFGWIEELPISHDALARLKRSLDRALPS